MITARRVPCSLQPERNGCTSSLRPSRRTTRWRPFTGPLAEGTTPEPRSPGALPSSTVNVAPWQCLSSAPAAPQGGPGGSRKLGTRRNRPTHWATDPLGAQPLPLVLERAASEAADFAALTIQALISSNTRLNASAVPTVSLSWLLKRHVPRSARVFGKMDIEGAEYTALPPAILTLINPNPSPSPNPNPSPNANPDPTATATANANADPNQALPPAIPQLCKYVDAMLLELHDKHLKQTREHLRKQTRDDAAGRAAVQASHDALQQSKALHGALAALEANRTAGKCRTKVKVLSATNT